ncbi:U4/U5/U6 small nuclear ribonucleoprotein prp3 [Ophidiomyces ophidiicola]|uniref:U4/U5/U6 small nuclear ribonucleoprotein prp3 n=1 Tax=Ophidiomyces ophidiicola TaxID=1387563 RepID=A0ACB8V503_9EURO|nr:U4/U5/U6 small nuclear ribonucleoprotein prp3 [Ophidiomyces ophidiicola]KAI1975939.1 U4/U5/U6 small nuclear ribonucleoprotein prp3 [Ophidiomyces ophidiicola]KAI2041664.1 U4/U5/U6 small nuclear ribonucleoprotein prp3 [Ophidiomyces ophidiicola]KAI2060163.1 U4/U5/U6 small nuclear ribonucleoprotein prp3 [Ophidiomyces ophidiicola]KAI2081794.1 U4/U5/U6 small nuclear ribonucleoprotein prp3 [Ophidiomyces ophidiicola]
MHQRIKMADASHSSLKRRHSGDENGTPKRPRSNHGSPAPDRNGGVAPKIDIQKAIAAAKAKAEAVRARLQAQAGGSPASITASQSPSPAPPATASLSRIEQMKARVAAATGRANAAVQPKPQPTPSFVPLASEEGTSRARGGLDVGLHPALLGDMGSDGRSAKNKQAMHPKFATTMANRQRDSSLPLIKSKGKQLDLSGPSIEETRNNPYFDPSLGAKTALARPRYSRQLVFNQKGKYIQQAAALRRQAQLEAMKKRIAERARQAGIDEDLDLEKAFLVPAPPAIEWWDEGLVNGTDYSAIDKTENLKIDSPDSVITLYIQHPVLLEPPQDKNIPPPKPMYLTPKEQAKIRRQRRMADLKEQQAKVRLGLEPAPPPKVKKSNLMRVLGEEAVKDPTAVEARVNREIAARAEKHMADNESRKLTKEERKEKLAKQQENDASKGIYVTVYRIDSLANGRHRFKISRNAEQHSLTGICVMHPKFNLLIVEGGYHSINAYKKLMLNRIDWTENAGPNAVKEGNREALAAWLSAEDEKTGELKDLSLNSCTLVWEGEGKARAFRKWLGARVCETDAAAKDTLTRAKMENFWTLAKTMKSSTT